jgi:hypothetical protein
MHDHDKKWVDEQLLLLPDPMRAKILAKYESAYASVIAQNEGKIDAEGLARRDANTRLRECVAKFGGAYHGQVIAPPMAR